VWLSHGWSALTAMVIHNCWDERLDLESGFVLMEKLDTRLANTCVSQQQQKNTKKYILHVSLLFLLTKGCNICFIP